MEVYFFWVYLVDFFQFGGRIEDYNQLVIEGVEQIVNYGDEYSVSNDVCNFEFVVC